MKHTLIGLDLAKNTFHAVGLDSQGEMCWRRQYSRKKLMESVVKMPPCTIAMEACGGSYYWARTFEAMGHDVVLLPAQHVKAYLRNQKNDYNDALAIAEAQRHGQIRAVRIKSVEEQDDQVFHRLRQQYIKQQTRTANQIRGLLSEFGIVLPQGLSKLHQNLIEVLEDAENGLSARFREMIYREYRHLCAIREDIKWFDEQLQQQVKNDEVCRRLMDIPGVGPVVSSALKSWMGNGKQFSKGRDASAALGLVPKQHSSGGKPKLLGITKTGSSYLRSLVVHGARSVVRSAEKKDDALSRWIHTLVEKRGKNRATVAVANKLVRMAWVVVAREECYRPLEERLEVAA